MFSDSGIIGFIVVSILVIIPFWRIIGKAGFHPALSLLLIIPIVNLITLYIIAFSTWPSRPS